MSENMRNFEHVYFHSLSSIEQGLIISSNDPVSSHLRCPRNTCRHQWSPQTQHLKLPYVVGVLSVSVLPPIDLLTLLHDYHALK